MQRYKILRTYANFCIKSNTILHEVTLSIGCTDTPHYENVPFEIPDSWEWTSLDIVCDKIVDGDHNPPKGLDEPTEYLMVSSRNINHNRIENLDNVRYLSKDIFEIENQRTKLNKGDILFTSVGSLGRSCIYNGDLNLCFQRSVSIIHTLVYNYWLKYFFFFFYYQNIVVEKSTGTAQVGFYLQQLSESIVAIPPLAEQKRIVEEIERWFALIDDIEAHKSDLQDYIKQTKSKVLDLAIHGKLVPQDPNDEPAIDLLKRINPSFVPCDTSHYENLPQGWCVASIEQLCSIIGGLWTGKKPPYVNVGVIRNTNFTKDFKLDLTNTAYLDVEAKQFANRRLQYGDIILEKSGGSEKQPVGRTILYNREEGDFSFSNFTAVLRIKNADCLLSQYLQYALVNAYLNGATRFMQKQTTGIHNLIMDKYTALMIPIPPLAEQKRIVEAIETIYKQLNAITAEL